MALLPIGQRSILAIATSLGITCWLGIAAQAQSLPTQPPSATHPDLGPAFLPEEDEGRVSAGVDASGGEEPVSPRSMGQATLPFSDVPPDHWAYEALLYLSTGDRPDQAQTKVSPLSASDR